MFEFIAKVWHDFWAASAMEQVGFVVSMSGLSVFFGMLGSLLYYFRYRNYRAIAHRQVDELAKLHTEVEAAEADAAHARAEAAEWQPRQWLKTAAKEREHGNEELAIRAIDDGVERVRADLAACMVALAGHHLSLIVSHDPEGHLAIGTRFARLASDLDPTDADAAFLLEEVQLLAGSDPGAVADNLPTSYLPHDQQEAISLLNAIFAHGEQWFREGHYRLCMRLYRRAELVAHRSGLARSEIGFRAAYESAEAMEFAGEHRRALDAVYALLPIQEQVLGKEVSLTLATRCLEARILRSVGEKQRALDAVSVLLPLLENVRGTEHPDTLATRCLEAQILQSMGEHQRALDAVNALLPLEEKVRGKEHRDTLVTRNLEAQILQSLGEHQRALDAVNALLPIRERVSGKEHPGTLAVRHLEAQILQSMGEHQRALDAVTALLPVEEKVRGKVHPDTGSNSRYLEAHILWSMGEHQRALDIINALLLLEEKVGGKEDPATLGTRYLEAHILWSMGEHQRALAAINALLPILERVLGKESPDTLAAQRLHARILVDCDSPDDALAI